jgi:hypothetical protein
MTRAKFSFTAGRLLCGHVRDFLKESIFLGKDIEYLESSGWFERTFTIKGNAQDILEIKEAINEWAKDNNLE